MDRRVMLCTGATQTSCSWNGGEQVNSPMGKDVIVAEEGKGMLGGCKQLVCSTRPDLEERHTEGRLHSCSHVRVD